MQRQHAELRGDFEDFFPALRHHCQALLLEWEEGDEGYS
jgi:hypothetical protein